MNLVQIATSSLLEYSSTDANPPPPPRRIISFVPSTTMGMICEPSVTVPLLPRLCIAPKRGRVCLGSNVKAEVLNADLLEDIFTMVLLKILVCHTLDEDPNQIGTDLLLRNIAISY